MSLDVDDDIQSVAVLPLPSLREVLMKAFGDVRYLPLAVHIPNDGRLTLRSGSVDCHSAGSSSAVSGGSIC